MAYTHPRLIAITDVTQFGATHTATAFERLCHAAAPGSVCVQLRWDAPAAELLALGSRLRELCAESRQRLAVNERLDVALALELGAAHLKSTSVAAVTARGLWAQRGEMVWLSRAWHPVDEPLPMGVDALVVSPVCAERKGRQALGIAVLHAAVVKAARVPVYALGGVDEGNVAPVVATGARGVAAIGACYRDPIALLDQLGILRGR